MKIKRVEAMVVEFPVRLELVGPDFEMPGVMCVVEIETDNGLLGHGITAITNPDTVAAAINHAAAPVILGEDAWAIERIWEQLYWAMSPRGQTGYAMHAIAAVDCALWDIKGKALGEPVWRLLGGARERVPLYCTFGFPMMDEDQLIDAAKHWIAKGFTRLKMTVADGGLRRRDEPRPLDGVIEESYRRVKAVRDAVGPDIEIHIDANQNLDHAHAVRLSHMLDELDIAFFEEPITQNDVRLMADMRARTSIPLACGQNEGLAFRFRDLMVGGAVDIVQPNAVITGGISQCVKIAGMAQAFNVTFANGGGSPYHNMHLHAGLANGTTVEFQYMGTSTQKMILSGLPEPADGWMELPDTPGLGFTADRDALREYAKKPA